MLGPTFGTELRAAGCADGVRWSPDGSVTFRDDVTPEQRAAVEAVVAAHDPTAQPSVPDPDGFLRHIPTIFGADLAGLMALAKEYPAFADFVRYQNGPAIQWCIQDAQSKGFLTPAQYDAFKAAVSAYHLPDITLP